MSNINEFSKFIRDLSTSLHTTKILYLGCYDIEDLSEFPENMNVFGITEDVETLGRVVERYPSFEFKQENPLKTTYKDNEFDFVFGHKLFNYLNKEQTQLMLKEMYRLSSKYIVNFEMFSEKEESFEDGKGHYCGMYSKWLDFQVKMISNVQMHEEIDPEQCQFTLVRKVY